MKKQDKKIEEVKELEAKVADLTAGWQRTQADFQNYKKQVAEDRAKLIDNASSDLIYDLLPVLDHFQLATKHLPKDLENNNWAMGIKQIEKQFVSILLENGLEKIEAVGNEFDPKIHEAVEEIESDKPEGTIIEEVLSGYLFRGQVLRATRVKVSKNTPPKN